MKIAIVKLSALGDIVHAMVVLQFIKEFNSNILIDWVVDEKFKELLILNPNINQVHSVNLSNIKKKKSIFLLIMCDASSCHSCLPKTLKIALAS